MTRSWSAALLAVSLATAALPGGGAAHAFSPGGPGWPSPRDRVTGWAWNAAGPPALAGSAATAAWGQWVTGEPREWAIDGGGYARRFGAASATTAITETSLAALAAALHEDVRYVRCPRPGIGPRVAYALRMTLMSRRADGSVAFSVAKTVSPFAGPLVTRTTLYPERYGAVDGALSGAFAVAMNAGWNLAYEFVLPARRR